MRLIKLIARGARALVPTSITDVEPRAPSSRINNGMAMGSNNYTNIIPSKTVSIRGGKYTPPPKNQPWAVIPDGVCRGCE